MQIFSFGGKGDAKGLELRWQTAGGYHDIYNRHQRSYTGHKVGRHLTQPFYFRFELSGSHFCHKIFVCKKLSLYLRNNSRSSRWLGHLGWAKRRNASLFVYREIIYYICKESLATRWVDSSGVHRRQPCRLFYYPKDFPVRIIIDNQPFELMMPFHEPIGRFDYFLNLFYFPAYLHDGIVGLLVGVA